MMNHVKILLKTVLCGTITLGVYIAGAMPTHAQDTGSSFKAGQSATQTVRVSFADNPREGDAKLVVGHHATDLCVDKDDFKVVQIAANCLADDIACVSGVKPRVISERPLPSTSPVLIGTIGKSTLIDELVRTGKLDTKSIAGKWECSIITTVSNPFPGINTALVIAGSDRRGTAFGVFSLSEAIGISPWVWWADVTPPRHETLTVVADTQTQGPPSVKYRGIFINDEDWGLQPWAAKTFEPETGDIGPKTYTKVCELLLRLKANYLWPAMHSCTKAFNLYPQNKIVAADYAIVMGSSHAEPMLRNNVSEWDKTTRGPWDYDKNRDGVLKYWEERVQENGAYENTYTVGMRGIHDSAMPGGGTTADKVARLQHVIADQRDLLARHVNPNVEQVPQIFVPYKEVLSLYQNGLQVPDDVTLVWPDDNHGYIRQLPTLQEQRRSGGSGVYYHVSYWGEPADYLWLCTTPPSLIWEEMRKAYDQGARDVWVLNVGDIKPAEIDTEFFLRLAWNINGWNETAQSAFLADWAEQNFGKEYASNIAVIMDEYYRLNDPVKPEHLLQAKFSNDYHEKEQRLLRFDSLLEKTNTLYGKLRSEQKDAFYETVAYPVRCSALINKKFLGTSPEQAEMAYDQIQVETNYYNEQIANGKWKNMMSANPRNQAVFQNPFPKAEVAPVTPAKVDEDTADRGYISIDAAHPTHSVAGTGTTWKTIAGLGRSGGVVSLLPTNTQITGTEELVYKFTANNTASVKVTVYCIPTHALHPDMQLRYSAAVDSDPPKIVNIDTTEFSPQWGINVLRAAALGVSEHAIPSIGKHILKLHPLDPGVLFDKVVIDLGGLKPSYLGPPENQSADH